MLPEYLFQRLKAVFFDAEGTLFQIKPSVGYIYSRVCAEFGLRVSPEEMETQFREVFDQERHRYPMTPEGCYQEWKNIFLKTVEKWGTLSDPDEAFSRCYQAFAQREFFELSPGAKEALSLLKEAGLKLAIVSNWDERLRSLVRAFGLEPFFEELFISCEIGLAKPDPTLYRVACHRLGVLPQETLMIGDHPEDDVLAARQAGLWALRYPGGDLRRLFPLK